MKKSLALTGMLLLLFGASGCSSSPDSLIKDQISLMNDMADALEKGDEAKAKSIAEKMKEVDKKLEALKLSEDDKKKLGEKYKDELTKAAMRMLQAQMKGGMKGLEDLGKGLGGGGILGK
jgi:hypothetical protein